MSRKIYDYIQKGIGNIEFYDDDISVAHVSPIEIEMIDLSLLSDKIKIKASYSFEVDEETKEIVVTMKKNDKDVLSQKRYPEKEFCHRVCEAITTDLLLVFDEIPFIKERVIHEITQEGIHNLILNSHIFPVAKEISGFGLIKAGEVIVGTFDSLVFNLSTQYVSTIELKKSIGVSCVQTPCMAEFYAYGRKITFEINNIVTKKENDFLRHSVEFDITDKINVTDNVSAPEHKANPASIEEFVADRESFLSIVKREEKDLFGELLI